MFITGKNVVGDYALTLLHSKQPKLYRVSATQSAIGLSSSLKMDGGMICDFMSFSTVFQSYQDDDRLIMKGCVQ